MTTFLEGLIAEGIKPPQAALVKFVHQHRVARSASVAIADDLPVAVASDDFEVEVPLDAPIDAFKDEVHASNNERAVRVVLSLFKFDR